MSSTESPLAGVAVLVADDNEDGAELLQLMLERQGARVQTATTGREALDVLQTFTPQVLLLDITLPDMDGFELLQAVHALPGFEHTPAVAVTGRSADRDKAKGAAAGFAVHVVKPFDAEALVHLVRTLARPGGDEPRLDDSPTVGEVRELLEKKGVLEALRRLNERTSHRYTGVYRFDGTTLRSVYLVDRLDPLATCGDDAPLDATYSSRVAAQRMTFTTADASIDPRLADHPGGGMRAYCGTLLRNPDGTPFGTVCHFDSAPREIHPDEIALLERVAPWIAARVLDAPR
jgi:CheY-like chemotaxis protein